MRSSPSGRARPVFAAALAGLCLFTAVRAAEPAPMPRPAPALPLTIPAAVELDASLIAEVKNKSEIMKNLQYISDVIGPRLTGSKNLERANKWTADKMKEYGLENVRLEPWEIPIGWERGTASMKVVEPETNAQLIVASGGWRPGTKGKITGPVVIVNPKTKDDLAKYKGKLKDAVVLMRPPSNVAPITDLNYGPGGGGGKKDATKKDEPKKDAVKKDPLQIAFEQPPEKKAEAQPPRKGGGGFGFGFGVDTEFLKAEGVACTLSDSGKPHGLLVTTGGWGRGDRGAQDQLPQLYMAHENYAMLWRLASREGAVTKVEVEISNKFIPGPIVVNNTVGEVRGSEKPDEIVVVGAHLDSWELASGTTDNGTGTCVVLETARVVAKMAKEGKGPKRTIRFCLFTGEEQGLHGSRQYVERHKAQLDKHSMCIVHDTGTGKVTGFGLQGRENVKTIMDGELASLKDLEGWKGLTMGGIGGGTDHWPFHLAGVPGFACNQESDEYRLTHHTQSDTFDKAKEPNLIQGAQVMSVTAMRVANLPDLLPRNKAAAPAPKKAEETKKD
jgi:carboxypeptidase Q